MLGALAAGAPNNDLLSVLELPKAGLSDVIVMLELPKSPCLGGSELKLNEDLGASVLVTVEVDELVPKLPNDGLAGSVTVELPNKEFGASVLINSFLTGAGEFVD